LKSIPPSLQYQSFLNGKNLSGQDRGLEGISQLVQVDDLHSLSPRIDRIGGIRSSKNNRASLHLLSLERGPPTSRKRLTHGLFAFNRQWKGEKET
jgi:hypothetical protein